MKRAVHAVAWVLLVTAALVLWPQKLGGTMTYVITHGTSMQPAFFAGDLAVLRSSHDYDVGDVVAHASAELDRIVMHRVVRASADGLVLRGDNNDFDDPETVSREQVLGELVLRVPAVGRVLARVTEPLHLGVLAVALLLLGGERASLRSAPSPRPVPSLRARRLDLPASAVTAHLVDRSELQQLAEALGRPVLEVEGDLSVYVVDGGVVYAWQPEVRRNERVRTPQGRDWGYERPALSLVPEPRSAAERVS